MNAAVKTQGVARLVLYIVFALVAGSASAVAAEVKARSQNVLSVDQIKAEYENFRKQYPSDPTGFESFAVQMDKLQDDDKRFEAYKAQPNLYPTMSRAWVERAFRDFKKLTKDSELSLSNFAWQMDTYEGGKRYFEGYRHAHADMLVLYDFMGVKMYPVLDVLVLEKTSGYIHVLQRDGKRLEHSGRFSIIE